MLQDRDLGAINYLAERLGVNLEGSDVAVAGQRGGAKVSMYDGSLETAVFLAVNGPTAVVSSPRSPSIRIKLVDHTEDVLAPREAIYEISAEMPPTDERNCAESLNGDVATVYVGVGGIILNTAGRRRVHNLPGERD